MENLGFSGMAPTNTTVEANVAIAVAYQSTHTTEQTYQWFKDHMRNNSDDHLPWDQSMDYKQLDPMFADFGNFNFGAVGKALGYSEALLKYAAGVAQGKADGLSTLDAINRALRDLKDKGDNPGDQDLIDAGIEAAKNAGFNDSDFDVLDAAKLEFLYVQYDLMKLKESLNKAWKDAQKVLPRRAPSPSTTTVTA